MEQKNDNQENKLNIIEELLTKVISKDINKVHDSSLTIGEKVADKIASVAGSWPFIIGFIVVLTLWITFNVVQTFKHFDEYPFILLNLALSCIAAMQAPIIMMSQKRQEEKDRIRSEQDYEINQKSEIIIKEIFKHVKKIEEIEQNQNEIMEYLKSKN